MRAQDNVAVSCSVFTFSRRTRKVDIGEESKTHMSCISESRTCGNPIRAGWLSALLSRMATPPGSRTGPEASPRLRRRSDPGGQ